MSLVPRKKRGSIPGVFLVELNFQLPSVNEPFTIQFTVQDASAKMIMI